MAHWRACFESPLGRGWERAWAWWCCCLGLCLRVGNVLNRNTPRGNARAFEVGVLPSLGAIKSCSDTGYSLLHHIARLLHVALEQARACLELTKS